MENWKTRTKLVHSGIKRSQFGELSEALFLTQGFAYDTAEQAEARFIQNSPDEYIYGRYGNPTIRMFEERMIAIEGAEDAFATATGMAAVSGALFCLLEQGDHIISSKALFGSCMFVVDNILREVYCQQQTYMIQIMLSKKLYDHLALTNRIRHLIQQPFQ